MQLKKFKSFREQPVKIRIDTFIENKIESKNINKPLDQLNVSNKSDKKSPTEEEFKSSEFSEDNDFPKHNPTFNQQLILPVRNQGFGDMAKRATIQEVSEDKEMNETLAQNQQEVGKINKEVDKITEEAKEGEGEEGIEFESSQEEDDGKTKKPLIIPSNEDEEKLLKKSLDEQDYEDVKDCSQVGFY
jgi:hypothetical protein